jgi:hypothetical protein
MDSITAVGYFSGAQLLGKLLALPTNIKLGWKDLPVTLVYQMHTAAVIPSCDKSNGVFLRVP